MRCWIAIFLIVVVGCTQALPDSNFSQATTHPITGHDKLVVFVHGFTGSPNKTWGLFPQLLREDPELTGVDVWVWDYPTSLLQQNPSIEEIGQSLRTELGERFSTHKVIYLVGHSMGGLVIQSMITEELKQGRAYNLKRIKHIILFGTPNRGAQVPELLKINSQLKQLSINSSHIETLLNEWVNRVYNPNIQTGDENSKLRIPVTAAAGLQDHFVTPESAKSFFRDPEPIVVPGDHSTMKEPHDREALAYLVVKRRILEQDVASARGPTILSDLVITPLTGGGRLLPLDGFQVISTDSQPVYPKGVKVSFTLTHNKRGTHSIILKGLSINLHRYVAAKTVQLAYDVRGDEMYGAGTTKPHTFYVSLRGNHIEPARWVLPGERPRAIIAKSGNFFDYEDATYLTLRADSDDLEEIRGFITAEEPGLYELSFVFSYSVGGMDRTSDTAPFTIYLNE